MTDDEVSNKWCPFARAVTGGRDSCGHLVGTVEPHNRVGVTGEPSPSWTAASSCIGSACMAWRWSEAKRTVAFLEAVQAHMKAQDKPNFNTAVQAVWSDTGGQFERVEGYCGLAGAPQ